MALEPLYRIRNLKTRLYFSSLSVTCYNQSFKGAVPPETEARNRKLTVVAMSLYFYFCVLWAYFVVTDRMSTNKGLQQAKFEE